MGKKKTSKSRAVSFRGHLSAFVDLVGVRDLAKTDPAALQDTLSSFRYAVGECLDSLTSPTEKVYFFSDCAFISFASGVKGVKSAENFLRQLREELFPRRMFFKASVCKGRLDAERADVWKELDASSEAARKDKVNGYFFGASAAELYTHQERLKGIGVWVDKKLVKESNISVVPSAYLSTVSEQSATAFSDIAWDKRSRSLVIFEAIRENVLVSRSRKISSAADRGKLGRYYITPLVSWAQSIDFSDRSLKKEVLGDINQLRSFDPLTAAIYYGELRSILRGIKGYELVFLAWANQVLKQIDAMDSTVSDLLFAFVTQQEGMLDKLAYVPEEVFPDEERKDYTMKLSKSLVRRKKKK